VTLISRTEPPQPSGPATAPADAGAVDQVRRLTAAAAEADGKAPLNEATLLSLQHRGLAGKALWRASDGDTLVGFALATPPPEDATGRVEINLVVAPEARGAGVGRALAETVLEAVGPREVSAWSHGNHPAAARLAERFALDRARDLWVLRRPLTDEHPLPEVTVPTGVVVRPFGPGQDEDAFLALNAEAFYDHPEQGWMTEADLEERMAEPWFDPAGFFVAEPADAPRDAEANQSVESPSLLGFHWTKVHAGDPAYGEVYVVGVSPAAQGQGLGRVLTLTGLHHLRERGLGEVLLYVEADNEAAVAMYSGLGFTHADEDTDVHYVRPATAAATGRA
jgi:mycothiol synthase